MKNIFTTILVTVGTAAVLCGCNKAESPKPASDSTIATPSTPVTPTPPAAPAVAPAAAPAETPTAVPAPVTPAPPAAVPAVEAVKSAASDVATKFVEQAKSAADSQLGTIATELTGKVQALGAAVGANDAVKSQLDSTLQSLAGGLDSTALGSAFKVAEAAKLTPEQIGLAKQVGDLASAYVVQKNFAALDGAQGDVATIVNSLRQGEINPAIPALKNVAQNAHLTDTQKQLISTVADKYAPGWQQAKGALDAIKKLPGF